jgi:hypothetical protein
MESVSAGVGVGAEDVGVRVGTRVIGEAGVDDATALPGGVRLPIVAYNMGRTQQLPTASKMASTTQRDPLF